MDRDEDNEKDDDDDDDHEEGEPMNMRKRLLKLAGHDPVSVFTFFLPVVSINPLSANPTKCSTHSNNSSAFADELFQCV